MAGARVSTSASCWARETESRITVRASVWSYTSVSSLRTATCLASSAKDATESAEPQVFKFVLKSPVATTGTLTLTQSGSRTSNVYGRCQINVLLGSGQVADSWTAPGHLRKKVVKSVTVGPSGLTVLISTCGVASLSAKGTRTSFMRASIRFDVVKKKS